MSDMHLTNSDGQFTKEIAETETISSLSLAGKDSNFDRHRMQLFYLKI
ncbi:MAG: hypothetical protein HKN69_06470 [Desulfofustis sp.]|nr:hypothetical protein [Desulfofustis sp.]